MLEIVRTEEKITQKNQDLDLSQIFLMIIKKDLSYRNAYQLMCIPEYFNKLRDIYNIIDLNSVKVAINKGISYLKVPLSESTLFAAEIAGNKTKSFNCTVMYFDNKKVYDLFEGQEFYEKEFELTLTLENGIIIAKKPILDVYTEEEFKIDSNSSGMVININNKRPYIEWVDESLGD